MTFASDRLYRGYLRRNMPTIASKVKVREIIPHLPCLTDHDRENIEAKREMYGNHDSMVLLLDCLKRREDWPEEFITALEECNQPTLAAEIRREYEALTGNSNRSSPSASVIRAHVHPAPSAQRLSIPESGGNREAAVAQPAETPAPPQPAAGASPPPQAPQQPRSPDTSAVPDSPPPEPVSLPQQPAQLEAAPLPSTPPPSPETQHARAANRSPPPQEVVPHQEPVENSEVTEDIAVDPDQLGPVDAPQPPGPVELSETDTPPQGEDVQTTTATAEVRPPTSPPATEVTTDVTYGSPISTATPEKAPVQDTTPPVLQEEKIPAPACAQDVAAAPLPVAAAMEVENDVCFSQPGDLVSVQPQPPDSPSMEPYSGNTARLEMSSVPASTTADTSSRLPCQENGITANYNQPEENHYDSPNQSLDAEEIRENTLQICEEPSILDLDGHDPTPQGQVINGEAAKEMIAVGDAVNAPPESGNDQPPEPAAGEGSPPQHPEKTPSQLLTSNTKYFVTAAGVGACALLLAWKFKN